MTWALFFFYMAGVSDGIRIACGAGLALFLITAFITLMATEDGEKVLAFLRKQMLWIVLLVLVCVFAPSRQFLYIAAGLSASQELAESPLAQKAYSVLDERLTEMLGTDK